MGIKEVTMVKLYRLECDGADCKEHTQSYETLSELSLKAKVAGWETFPDVFVWVCPKCAKKNAYWR